MYLSGSSSISGSSSGSGSTFGSGSKIENGYDITIDSTTITTLYQHNPPTGYIFLMLVFILIILMLMFWAFCCTPEYVPKGSIERRDTDE